MNYHPSPRPSPTRGEGEGHALKIPSPLVGEGKGEGTSLLDKAKRLRSQMTEAEQHLWRQLRAKRFAGFKFRRQVPMEKYIADFVCFDAGLVIELDGGQHSLQQDYDQRRDRFFAVQGFRVLRFWNNEVMENMEGVLLAVEAALNTPLSGPLPQGEREMCKELV